MAIVGKQQVFSALDRLNRNIDRFAPSFPQEILTKIIREVNLKRAIKTGALVLALDFREGVTADIEHRYFIDTLKDPSVTYDGWVEGYPEHGYTTPNPGGKTFRQGRKIYKGGIEAADIKGIADRMISDSFRV